MMAGCYDLTLRCDGEGCGGKLGARCGTWTLDLGSACRSAARSASPSGSTAGQCLPGRRPDPRRPPAPLPASASPAGD
jgi:hypothetical protein